VNKNKESQERPKYASLNDHDRYETRLWRGEGVAVLVHVVSFVAAIVVHTPHTHDSALSVSVRPRSVVMLSLFDSFLVVEVLAELLDTGAREDAKDHTLILIEF
jgi:hypothetical protein